mgnify:CR=1 FL=1
MAHVLELDKLVVGYDGRALLPPVSLCVEADQRWALIGANGSGKTTMLRTILGLLPPVGGTLRMASGATVGYVPQRTAFDLSVPMRALDVVRGGLERGWSFLNPMHQRAHRDQIKDALRDTNTAEIARLQFAHLSEGQKQRVLMARAIVAGPCLLVLDEPTSAMDMAAEKQIFELIGQVQARRNMAVLLVSHHLPVTARFASHGLFVDRDASLVVSGQLDTLASEPALVARYGDVLKVSPDAPDTQEEANDRG